MAEKPTYEELVKRVQEFEQAESARKSAKVFHRERESQYRMKIDNTLLPEGVVETLGLADIMDMKSIQSMMYDFFKLTNIGVGIIDPALSRC